MQVVEMTETDASRRGGSPAVARVRTEDAAEATEETSASPDSSIGGGTLQGIAGSARKLVGRVVAHAIANRGRTLKEAARALAAKRTPWLVGKDLLHKVIAAAAGLDDLDDGPDDKEAALGEQELVSRRKVPAASRVTPPEVKPPDNEAPEVAPLLATALIPGTELARLVASITPFRVIIDEARGRAVTLERPTLELVAGQGIRLRGSGVISWDFAHVPIPVRVNAWQLLFVPRVGSRGGSQIVWLEPLLEDLDVKSAPGFVDEKIAAAIRRMVTEHQYSLAWNIGRTLSRRLLLPAKVSPTRTFAIYPVGGEASVNEREVRLVLRFEARFEAVRGPEETAVPATEGPIFSS